LKVVILAGGLGTRLAEETEVKPKPMVPIGDKPIIWHIMKIYSFYGFKEFFITLGYKGEYLKKYFLDSYTLSGDITVNLNEGKIVEHKKKSEDWIVHLIDTGLNSQTGGRVKRLEKHLTDELFLLTYGDGVSDIDLNKLLEFHKSHGLLATVTVVHPPARFGGLNIEGELVTDFSEKPQTGEGWINGGFMVLNKKVLNYIKEDDTVLERDILEHLASEKQLAAYKHVGFWQCMDTLRDKRSLESYWNSESPPWKVW